MLISLQLNNEYAPEFILGDKGYWEVEDLGHGDEGR